MLLPSTKAVTILKEFPKIVVSSVCSVRLVSINMLFIIKIPIGNIHINVVFYLLLQLNLEYFTGVTMVCLTFIGIFLERP